MSAPDSWAARNAARPVRPKPFIATRMLMSLLSESLTTLRAVPELAIRGSGGYRCGLPAAPSDRIRLHRRPIAMGFHTACGNRARIPPRCSTALRRCERPRREPGALEKPRDHGVRVPHLARPQLVPPPDRRRDSRNERDEPTRELLVVTHASWAVDRFGRVRNDTVEPTPHLVAEQPKTPSPPSSDGAFRDGTALTVPSPRRTLLDHEAPLGQAHHERRVVEVTPRPSFLQRDDGLEERRPLSRTEWPPAPSGSQ